MGDGHAIMAKADKKLQGGFFANLFAGSSRYDEAAELYNQAAIQFKLSKSWKEASEAYVRCGQCHKALNNVSDEANCWLDAGNMMKKYSTSDAVTAFQKAIELYNGSGRYSQSAKLLKTLAETFEQENNFESAVDFYQRAADLFELDDFGKSNYSTCILKVAEHGARWFKKIEPAIKIYEREGEKALSNNLISMGARNHFLKAGVLHIASGDAVNAKLACERYEASDPRFAGSREGRLLKALVEAYEQRSIDQFMDAIGEYDRITPLDPWVTHFLFQIRQELAPTFTGEAPSLV